MKKLLVGGIILTGVLASWGCGPSEPPQPTEAPAIPTAPRLTETPTGSAPTADTIKIPVLERRVTDAEVGQKVKCPVMGTEVTVTKDTLSAEYKGKVYYFCCGGCPEEFKADPEKFAK